MVPLGSPVEPLIAELSQQFQTRAIDGGWEVRSRVEDARVPLAAIGVKGAKVFDVSLTWGPGVTPTLEEMVAQLVLALPGDTSCSVQTHAGPFEGGTSRNVRWECSGHRVWLNSSVWSSTSGSASILVRLTKP